MTVAELIVALQAMPQDAVVYTPDPQDKIRSVVLWEDVPDPGVYLL